MSSRSTIPTAATASWRKRTSTSIADLKGKKVAVNDGSVSEFYLNVLLGKAGLKESDLNTVNMTAADAGSAFVAKRVDAAVTWEPWLTKGKSTDFGHLLVDSSTTPGLITDVLIVKTAWAKAHKKDVAAIVKSWDEAVAYYRAHPDESIAIMAKGVGGWLKDPKEFKATLSGIKFYGGDDNKTFFGTKDKPGPLAQHGAGCDRHLVEPRQAAGQGDPGGPDQLQLRRRLMASFLDAYVAPKKDIPRRAYLTVSTLVAAAILALWCVLSYGGLVRGDFLPTPDAVVAAAINGIGDGSLLREHQRQRHRDHVRLHHRLDLRRAARHPDGQLQDRRGGDRAGDQFRALPAGLRADPAADPVGRHRHDARRSRSSSSARSSSSSS